MLDDDDEDEEDEEGEEGVEEVEDAEAAGGAASLGSTLAAEDIPEEIPRAPKKWHAVPK